MTKIPCPFRYAKGKPCTGHIVRIEAYKADLSWELDDDGEFKFGFGQPRSHYHLFCSEKGNHAGFSKPDSDQLKFYFQDLSEDAKAAIAKSG